MGKVFGNLATVRGILYFRLSPYEQKAYAGALTKGFPNFIPRTFMTMPFWLPPFLFGSFLYIYLDKAHRLLSRKNPNNYLNEVDPNPPPPPPPPSSEKKC